MRWDGNHTTILSSREPAPSIGSAVRFDGTVATTRCRHAPHRVSTSDFRQEAFDPNLRSTNALPPDNGQNTEPYPPRTPGLSPRGWPNICRSGAPPTNAPDEGVTDSRMRCPICNTETLPTSIMRRSDTGRLVSYLILPARSVKPRHSCIIHPQPAPSRLPNLSPFACMIS
jgi:hypothetical protein